MVRKNSIFLISELRFLSFDYAIWKPFTIHFFSLIFIAIFSRLSNVAVCKCKFHSLCDTYEKHQLELGNSTGNTIENPSMCEFENVHKVYNEIANHFSETRHSPWPQVNEFIQMFEIGSVLIDIGCGNGKYLQSNPDIFEVNEMKSSSFYWNQSWNVSYNTNIFFSPNEYFFIFFRLVVIEVRVF